MSQTKAKAQPLGALDTPKPPYKNPQAEKALTGCFLYAPETLDQLGHFFKPDDFSEPRLVPWFLALKAVYRPGDTEIDHSLLREALKRLGRNPLDIGELQEHELTNHAAVTKVWDYARVVLENAVARERLEASKVLAVGKVEEALQRINDAEARLVDFSALQECEPQPSEPTTCDQVRAFPVHVFPQHLQAFVREGAQAIHCPLDFFGAPILAALGAAIGNARCLEIKPGWRERPWVWMALVAQTGEKKSPALERIMEPLEQRQQFLKRSYDVEYRAWEDSRKENSTMREPRREQVYTTDATIEALADMLAVNPRGVLFFRDELAAWALGMNQYKNGKGSDRPTWLSFWNGGVADISRRGRRQSLALHKPYVGVMGALPPDMLGDLSDDRGREDGFVHRILFAFPDSIPRRYTEAVISQNTQAGYQAVFDALCKLTPEQDEHSNAVPGVVTFTLDGKREWVAWITEHYQEQESPDFPANLRGPWQKLEGYAARFALILHLCRVACGEAQEEGVDEVSMAGAAELVDYFKSHARRVYARLYATPEDRQVLAAVAWIKRQPGQATHHRAFQRSGVQGVKTRDDAKRLLLLLEDRGYGAVEEVAVRGGRRLTFTLKQDSTLDRNVRGQEWSAA